MSEKEKKLDEKEIKKVNGGLIRGTSWHCTNCGAICTSASKPSKCPECGGTTFD